jgi:hypothetical protein
MHPSLPNEISFEQGLSNKLHNSLVIKNKSKPKESIKQPTGAITSTTSAFPVAPSTKKATQLPAKSHSCAAVLPTPISDISSSVSGTREKKRILEEYVSKLGSVHQESFITKKKGKLDINEPLHFCNLIFEKHEAFLQQVLPGGGVNNVQRHHNSHPRIHDLLQNRAIKFLSDKY